MSIGCRNFWRSRVLNNMSAPPRSLITVRPLRPSTDVSRFGPVRLRTRRSVPDERTVVAMSTGLVPIALLSPALLARQWFPHYLDVRMAGSGASWDDKDRLKGRAAYLKHLRLRCLVVLSRIAVGELKHPNRLPVFRLAHTPVEELEATYLDNVRRLDPLALGLPPFGLAKPMPAGRSAPLQVETNPARALALLSRCSGTVYSAGREPLLPDYNQPSQTILVLGIQRRTGGNSDE